MMLREKMRPVEKNLVARVVNFTYEPTLRLFLRFKRTFLVISSADRFLWSRGMDWIAKNPQPD